MKQRDALEIFSFTNYYGAHVTTVLLSAANSVTYAVKTASIVKQHKRVETLLERDSITDLASTEGRLVHLRDTALLDSKIPTIKPQPPMSIPQARINSLKQGVARSKDQLNVERERQHKQREVERTRQQQQR